MADPHDWHLFDAEAGLEVRQVTAADQLNRWEVRNPDGEVRMLTDAEFDALRGGDGGG